jgi:predicted dehydrogenase
LEAQRERTGKVRALVLKGRQQGISTYIGGRYYWRASHSKGVRVFILTHEQDATNNLFGMVERYHSHCPDLVKPVTGAANAKELSFEALESGYAVGTAGAKATGRSQTVQLFHGSEVAFWPNAKTHFAGVVQAIPDLPGN